MTVLTIAALTALTANPACTVPGMAPQFWKALLGQESSYNANALHDDTVDRAYYPSTAVEAEAIATRLMAAGHSVGVGLSGLTASSISVFYEKFGLTIGQALEPCTNLKAGAWHYVERALSIYNSGSPTRGVVYAHRVMARVDRDDSEVPSPPPRKAEPTVNQLRDLLHPSDQAETPSALIQISQQPNPKDNP